MGLDLEVAEESYSPLGDQVPGTAEAPRALMGASGSRAGKGGSVALPASGIGGGALGASSGGLPMELPLGIQPPALSPLGPLTSMGPGMDLSLSLGPLTMQSGGPTLGTMLPIEPSPRSLHETPGLVQALGGSWALSSTSMPDNGLLKSPFLIGPKLSLEGEGSSQALSPHPSGGFHAPLGAGGGNGQGLMGPLSGSSGSQGPAPGPSPLNPAAMMMRSQVTGGTGSPTRMSTGGAAGGAERLRKL